MSTKEEQRSAFLMKRLEFRTRIKKWAEEQKDGKIKFRATKSAEAPEREASLARQRAGIVQTRAAIRYLLLAYAMFRGKPYVKVEQKCNDVASAYEIWDCFKRMGLKEKYDKAHIELWLSGETLPRIELPPLQDMELELPAAAAG